MGVEQRAQAVAEDDRTAAGRGAGTGTVLAQNPLDGGKEDVQCGVQHCRIRLEVIAQALGHRPHPLPHRQARDYVVGKMGGGRDHAPGGTGRADPPTLAGVGDEEVVTTVSAAGAGKAVGEDAALEIAAKFPLDRRRGAAPGPVIRQCQPGGKMCLYRAVEQRALGLATAVDSTAGRGAGGGGQGRPER